MLIKKVISLVLSCSVCLSSISCASTDIAGMGRGSALQMYEDETRMWKRSKEMQEIIDKSGYIYEDEALGEYITSVLHKLIGDIAEANNLDLKVGIIKDPFFNAFSLPDGVIYIHTGLLANSENEAQLAAVLGHEASHFLLRHSLREHRSTMNKTAFFNVVNMTVGTAACVVAGAAGALLAGVLGKYGLNASIFGYSRQMEREADENAFKLIKEAGYNPHEAKKFLETLAEMTEGEDKIPYFYSTHPRIKERIETFEELIKESGSPAEGINNAAIYNSMVKNLILENAELDMKRKNGLKSARRQIARYNNMYADDFKAYYLLGKLNALEGNKEEAEERLKKSIELVPDFAESHKELGLLYYKDDKKQDARAEFEKYLALEPQAKDAEYVRGYMNE